MTLTLDARQSNFFSVVVTAAITAINIVNGAAGQCVTLLFTQDATGHAVSAGGGNIQGFVAPTTTPGSVSVQQLICDATENLWVSPIPTSGGGTPGGGDTAVQFNNAGAFGGDENSFSWDEATKSLLMENGGAESVFQFVAGATGSMDITLDATQSPPVGSFDNTESGGTLNFHSDGDIQIISDSGKVNVQANGSGALTFFNGTGHTKETITGSKGANAALTSLLAALAAYGLITDSTT